MNRTEESAAAASRPAIVGLDCVYRYLDEHGRVLFERPRWRTDAPPPRHKMITYRWRPEAWTRMGIKVWNHKKHPDADRYLYHLPDLLAAKAKGEEIWWCEGEKDAGRLEEELESGATTSHHGGAGKVTPAQVEWFRGHTGPITLLLDRDEDDPRGGNAGAMDVIKRYDLLLTVGIRPEQITVAAPQFGKDIHDHLEAGLTPDDVLPVDDLTDLRAKAERTRSAGLAWAGYDPEMVELAELLDEFNKRGGWRTDRADKSQEVANALRAQGWRVKSRRAV